MSSVEIQRQSVWVSVLCVLSKQTVGGRTRSEAASCRRISSIVLEAVKCVKRNGYFAAEANSYNFLQVSLFLLYSALFDIQSPKECPKKPRDRRRL